MTPTIVTLVCTIALAILPHLVARFPALAKGESAITAVINALAGNYGAAKNAISEEKK